jgi:protein-S-isoprenylcysteine O-methyltransferase Ste14
MATIPGSTIPTPRDREAALRPLGPRGEGWIGIQMLLEIGCLVASVVTGPLLGGAARLILAVGGFGLLISGALLFVWGASHLGGTFSIWVTPREGGRLTTTGPYRLMRHPVCTAQVLLCAGFALAGSSVVALLLVPVVAWYLDRYKLAREEQTLLARYEGYAAYIRAVPHRMLPWPAGTHPSPGTGTR